MPKERYDLKKYEKQFDKYRFKKFMKPELKRLIKRADKILDFGCGTGYFLYKLSKLYLKKKFYGIDRNRSAILNGRKAYKRKNLNLTYGKLKKKTDLVITTFVLHEIKGTTILKQVKEFYKHLNPGGFFFDYDFRKVPKKTFKKHFIEEEWHGDFEKEYKEHNRYSKKNWEKIFKKAGFKTIALRTKRDVYFVYVGQKVK